MIEAILHLLNDAFTNETINGFPCRRLGGAKTLHELLRLEFVGQLAEALIIAGAASPDNKLLVLIGEVVECHFAEEKLLAAVLDVHCQATQAAVLVIHRQRAILLPLIPMAHQDKGQRDADAVVRNTLQQRAVCLVTIKLGYLHV